MHKFFQLLFSICGTVCCSYSVQAQSPAMVKQGPSGIFISLGKEIPSGKTISAYKIERSENNDAWKQIAEIKTPATFEQFYEAIGRAQLNFPSQVIPSKEKLSQLYQKAVSTGHSDSLKGMRLLFPIRVALGTMYYDTSAAKHITYRYRIISAKTKSEIIQNYVTDTISLPFTGKFDTISYCESSYNTTSLMVKWKSVGKNPAPLFMVYKFRHGAPVAAKGSTSRYIINDTTYYTYNDSTIAGESNKELQYFVSPYDQYGNSGLSSQVAVFTQDNFNKADFVRNRITFMPKLAGVQVCWHYTDPVTVKNIEIFRSENPKSGFGKIAATNPGDTSYLDQRIWPEKTYYYYVQAVAKAGKRTRQSAIMTVQVPGIFMLDKLSAPLLKQVSVANNKIRLLIEVNDTSATHLRIYRRMNGGGLVSLPGLIETGNASVISYNDLSISGTDLNTVSYAVRNEKDGTTISSLSDEVPVALADDKNKVSYFYAFPSNNKIELYWDDVAGRQNNNSFIVISRKTGAANSKSPLKVIEANLTGSSFTDGDVMKGNTYTYELRLTNKVGTVNEKVATVTTTMQ